MVNRDQPRIDRKWSKRLLSDMGLVFNGFLYTTVLKDDDISDLPDLIPWSAGEYDDLPDLIPY